ncbi:porin [Paraburkholderia strydomiana]|uniref:porin n=1 Tax=Paraburkholderia strydomiana TaxID=1245417 RepID=UPI0038BBA778
MKPTQITFAAAIMLAACAAHAQSSATLYGLIDEGLDFTSNAVGHRAWQMVSGNTAGSRFGIKGSEDLGDGMQAVFQLENAFDLNSGSLEGGRMFGRQAWVGLASNRWGRLTFGRQYDPSIDLWSDFTATGSMIGDLAAHPYNNDNADYSWHINNSVKYVTPTIAGLTGEVMYGFGNQAGSFADNRMIGAGASYVYGPISASFVYTRMDSPGSTSGGALGGDQVFTADAQQNIDAGVKYTFANHASVGLAWSHTNVYAPTANAFVTNIGTAAWDSWKFDNFEINGQYYLTPALSLTGEYTFTHATMRGSEGQSSPSWQQVALMLNYSVSPRTSVYLQGAYQHAQNGHTGSAFDYANIVYSADVSSSPNQAMARVGILHTF